MYKDDYNLPEFMNKASFWTNIIHNADKVILNHEDIDNFNLRVKSKISSLQCLNVEEKKLSGETLIRYIDSYKIPSKDMYDSNGNLVSKNFYKDIINNTNIDAVKYENPIKYGISIKKISLRSFPTDVPVFSSINHSKLNNFDRFQETGCNPCEPLLVLHESRDKNWYFVKMYNYIGWTRADGVAISEDEKQILDYVSCKDFLIVTSKEAFLKVCDENSLIKTIKCGMGTKLCLSNSNDFIVKYPFRNSNGHLVFKEAHVCNKEDFQKGYLPYTIYNIIIQAFKFLDSPYDWGEKFDSKDCSSFIMTIFKCFGFLLPRNADDQEKSFYDESNVIIFNTEDTIKERYTKMDMLKPGTALFMKGHTMLYLGKYEGVHYMIHTFAGYSVKNNSSLESKMAMCTAVSPVDLITSSGVPFVEKFTSAVFYR